MKSAEIKDISIKDLQERIETEKAQLAKLCYELGIPADIRGKLGFPSDGLSGRASSEETAASARSIPV